VRPLSQANPQVAAKTRQKHDYPSQAWRISYARRTAAERLNAAIKDTAANSIDRGWIRLHGGGQDRAGPPGWWAARPAASRCGRGGTPASARSAIWTALLTVRPDRARCTGCGVSHVVLDAGLLPGRAYAAGLIGQALVASARGHGHRRIAAGLAVPAGTVRGWIRGARRSATQLRITGIRAVLASGQGHLLAWARTDELGPH